MNSSSQETQDRRQATILPHPMRRAEDQEQEAPKKRARRKAATASQQSSVEHDRPVAKKARRPGKSATARRRPAKAKPAAPKRPERLYLRGTNLQPPGHKLIPCLAGSKQSILVDQLRRREGASMEELLEALSGGRRSWTEATVRSGFGWDLKLKGYGVRSTFADDGSERFHLVVPKGQRIPKHSPIRVTNKK